MLLKICNFNTIAVQEIRQAETGIIEVVFYGALEEDHSRDMFFIKAMAIKQHCVFHINYFKNMF